MERNEISLHQVKVYQCLAASKRWMTNSEIAQAASVAPRTARHHTKTLVALGIFDQAEVFPNHAYRLSDKAKQRNAGYLLRLERAQEVFASLAVRG
jgi:DNA-binding IclR family transcriptional regulator